MRAALQHQGMPLCSPKMDTLSLNRLQGLSNSSTVSDKMARAHPLRSSRKVESLVSTGCCSSSSLTFCLARREVPWHVTGPRMRGVMLVLY